MIELRAIILTGLLPLLLLHSGLADSAIIDSNTNFRTTQWTWDSFGVPFGVGQGTIEYDIHAFNIVTYVSGSGSLTFDDSNNFTLQLNITNMGTAFDFTEVSGDRSNDFGQGVGLDILLVAAKNNGVLSANGSITTSPGSQFDTPWGVASVEYSLDISDVNVAPLGGNLFGIAFGDGIDVSFTVDSATMFTMNGGGSFEVTLVPVPPAIWLFGSGFLGLIGMAKKKAA